MEDEAEDMMPQNSDEESNLTLQQRLDIVARKFQKQIMRVHVVEEAVLCVQVLTRPVGVSRKLLTVVTAQAAARHHASWLN